MIVDIITALGVLTTAIVAFVKAIYPYFKAKVSEVQDRKIQDILDTVVMAAEQMKKIGEVVDKLEYAMAQAESMLSEAGITLRPTTIRAEIESRMEDINA